MDAERFYCDQCDKSYTIQPDLNRHIRSIHDGIKDFKCTQCDYASGDVGNLNTHIKMVHDRIRDVFCSQCDYACFRWSELNKHTKRCVGKRTGSDGEAKVRDVLDGLGIKYAYNQTNVQLTRYCGQKLRFDFEIDMHGEKLFIEFDGRQHFEPIRFGMSKEQAQLNFEKQKRHDRIKNRFCNDYDYRLLRIPYTETLHIEERIIEFLQQHTLWGYEL